MAGASEVVVTLPPLTQLPPSLASRGPPPAQPVAGQSFLVVATPPPLFGFTPRYAKMCTVVDPIKDKPNLVCVHAISWPPSYMIP